MSLTTSFELLDNYISSFVFWTEEEKWGFFSLLQTKHYAAGSILVGEYESCNKLFFVTEGLLSTVVRKEPDQETIVDFAFVGNLFSNWPSFLLGNNNDSVVRAEKDSECIIITSAALAWLYSNVKEGNRLGRLMFQQFHFNILNRSRLMFIKKSWERYQRMQVLYPEIEDLVPQKLISSFIGIDASHLCRMKKSQSLNNNTLLIKEAIM